MPDFMETWWKTLTKEQKDSFYEWLQNTIQEGIAKASSNMLQIIMSEIEKSE